MISEVEALLRLILAGGLGALIGIDRESHDKPAGVRTFAIVSLGACLFTLVGVMGFVGGDETSRVVSTIITGVGFLGAGTILHRRSDIVGLTTAAGIWSSAGIGMALGMGLYVLAAGGAILIVLVLWLFGWLTRRMGGRSDKPGPSDEEDEEGETKPKRFDRPEDLASKG